MRSPATIGLCLLAGLAMPISAPAASYQPLEDVREAALEFVRSNLPDAAGELSVEIGMLDSRLKLEKCSQGLESFLTSGRVRTGSLTVGVRCPGTRPWSLYVPVKAKLVGPVVVLARPVARGHVIARDDVSISQRDISGHHGQYYASVEQVLGRQARKTLPAGRALSRLQLEAPRLFERGDRVALVATGRGFAIRMAGRALENGTAGDRVKVRNLSSKRVVEGTVTEMGEVHIGI